MDLNDHRWAGLRGGYKDFYDPRPAVANLVANNDAKTVWAELWNELHHQGDIGDASFAAVILLVDALGSRPAHDWNLFALAATIEIERHRKTNPPIPQWLFADYKSAWRQLVEMALKSLRSSADEELVQFTLAVVALGHNAVKLGALINYVDDSELDEMLNDKIAWRDLYAEG
ncbi:MAG TPA: hypothetical protein VIT88_05270 [Pyrinomonadaceae bacterium]